MILVDHLFGGSIMLPNNTQNIKLSVNVYFPNNFLRRQEFRFQKKRPSRPQDSPQSDFAIRTSHCSKLGIVLIASHTRASSQRRRGLRERGLPAVPQKWRRCMQREGEREGSARVREQGRPDSFFSRFLTDALTVSQRLTGMLARILKPQL